MPGRTKVRQERIMAGLQASRNINYVAEGRLQVTWSPCQEECPLTSYLSCGEQPLTRMKGPRTRTLPRLPPNSPAPPLGRGVAELVPEGAGESLGLRFPGSS